MSQAIICAVRVTDETFIYGNGFHGDLLDKKGFGSRDNWVCAEAMQEKGPLEFSINGLFNVREEAKRARIEAAITSFFNQHTASVYSITKYVNEVGYHKDLDYMLSGTARRIFNNLKHKRDLVANNEWKVKVRNHRREIKKIRKEFLASYESLVNAFNVTLGDNKIPLSIVPEAILLFLYDLASKNEINTQRVKEIEAAFTVVIEYYKLKLQAYNRIIENDRGVVFRNDANRKNLDLWKILVSDPNCLNENWYSNGMYRNEFEKLQEPKKLFIHIDDKSFEISGNKTWWLKDSYGHNIMGSYVNKPGEIWIDQYSYRNKVDKNGDYKRIKFRQR